MLFVRDYLKDQQVFSSPSANPAPTVSVILPTYRRCKEGLLERSIKSVLSQTFQDFELLVMDDGSTDGSSALIDRYCAQDPRVIHVRHERNSGLPSLRVNEGLELAHGKYVIGQFDDDMWHKNALDDLVTEAKSHSEPTVVVGRSIFHNRFGRFLLPATLDVGMVQLTEINRFPNNGVLFPRSLVETLGMYDPHIGMRRLCDWDLWLRYMKLVPFVVIDKVITEVFESSSGAIALTVPYDISLFRYMNSIPRDHLLTPSVWHDYEIDSLRIGEVELQGEVRRRVYEEQIVPYYLKHRDKFPQLGSFSAALPQTPPKTLLYTTQVYDTCIDVTLSHYDRLTNQRGSYKTFYHDLGQYSPDWKAEADILLLMRTVKDEALKLVDDAQEADLPIGLYLDDDMLAFHEYGEQFNYLSPGTPYFQNLSEVASLVDAVLVTTEPIGDVMRPLNPRIVPHNNTIPGEYLPDEIHKHNTDALRIGYVGSSYRIDEFTQLWDALVRISREYGDRLCFEFWGIDVSTLPPLASPIVQKPFTFSYPYYLKSLRQANFDILLTPLLDHPRPRLAKSLIKYYETAVAGALGIFSDVPPYQKLPDGLTCLKAKNDVQSWYQKLRMAIEMEAAEFDGLRLRCLEHVREEYSVPAQIDQHEAALRAIEFHAKTRLQRGEDGQPRVIYVLHSTIYGGGELQLLRRLRMTMKYGIKPIVVIPSVAQDTESGLTLRKALEQEGIQVEAVEYQCFTEPRGPKEFFSEPQRSQIRELVERCSPALVHTVTFIPSFGQVCQEMKIPHVSTLYQVDEDFNWQAGRPDFEHCTVIQSDTIRYANRWSALLARPRIVSRDLAPQELFDLGQVKYLVGLGKPPQVIQDRPYRLLATGTFQPRKQQLETIQAVGRLKKEGFNLELDFYGYTHFYPEYVNQCYQAIQEWDLEDHVSIHEFSLSLTQALESADISLCLSTAEGFPGSIKDALAARVLVVATPIGGIPELILDGITGVLCAGTSVDDLADGIRRALAYSPEARQRILEQGRRIARLEAHPQRIVNDLFRMYNLALDIAQGDQRGYQPPVPVRRSESASQTSRARIKSPTEPPASLTPVGRGGVIYAFTPEAPNWSGLELLYSTIDRPVSGNLILKVRSDGGNIVREVTKELSTRSSQSWVEMLFHPIKNSGQRPFQLEITFDTPGGPRLSLFESVPARHKVIRMFLRLARVVGFRTQGRSLYSRVWYSRD